MKLYDTELLKRWIQCLAKGCQRGRKDVIVVGFVTEQAGSYCTEEEKKVGGGTTESLWNGVSNALGPSEGNSCSNNLLLSLAKYC